MKIKGIRSIIPFELDAGFCQPCLIRFNHDPPVAPNIYSGSVPDHLPVFHLHSPLTRPTRVVHTTGPPPRPSLTNVLCFTALKSGSQCRAGRQAGSARPLAGAVLGTIPFPVLLHFTLAEVMCFNLLVPGCEIVILQA